jgi:hypothetical protein
MATAKKPNWLDIRTVGMVLGLLTGAAGLGFTPRCSDYALAKDAAAEHRRLDAKDAEQDKDITANKDSLEVLVKAVIENQLIIRENQTKLKSR